MLMLADGFALGIVRVEGAMAAAALRQALVEANPASTRMTWLQTESRRPQRPVRLLSLVDDLLRPLLREDADGAQDVVVVDGCHADRRDAEAWHDWLRRWNEVRDVVAKRTRCPTFVLLPTWLFLEIADQAPDLWSIRSQVQLVETPERPADLDGAVIDNRSALEGVPLVPVVATLAQIEATQRQRLPNLERRGDERGRAKAVMELAQGRARTGELAEAERLLRDEALPTWRGDGDRVQLTACWGRIAELRAWQGDHDEALQLVQREVLPARASLAAELGRAEALALVAEILDARDDPEQASELRVREVMPVLARHGARERHAVALARVLAYDARRGDVAGAMARLGEELVPMLAANGADEALAEVRIELSGLQLAAGAVAAAAAEAGAAWSLALRVESLELAARAAMALADAVMQRGDAAALAHWLIRAYGAAEQSGRAGLIARAAMAVAQVYEAQGRREAALAALARAEAMAERLFEAELMTAARAQRAALASAAAPGGQMIRTGSKTGGELRGRLGAESSPRVGRHRAPIVILSDIEGFTSMSGEEQRASVRAMWAAIVGHKVVGDGGEHVHLIGTGDGAYILFPCTDFTPSFDDIMALAIDLAVAAESATPPFAVRVGVHVGSFEFLAVSGGRTEAIGPVLNQCARLCGIGDGGHVIVSDAFVREWLMDHGAQVLERFHPSDLDHPWEVFVKHGESMRVRMYLRPNAPQARAAPPPRKLAQRDAVEQHIFALIREVHGGMTAWLASMEEAVPHKGDRRRLDARVSIWGLANVNGRQLLRVTEYRVADNGARVERHARVIDPTGVDLGPAGEALHSKGPVVVHGLPAWSAAKPRPYVEALAKRCRIAPATVAQWSRHARAFLCLPFGIVDATPLGVICIDVMDPLKFRPPEVKELAQHLHARYAVALGALWMLRTSS